MDSTEEKCENLPGLQSSASTPVCLRNSSAWPCQSYIFQTVSHRRTQSCALDDPACIHINQWPVRYMLVMMYMYIVYMCSCISFNWTTFQSYSRLSPEERLKTVMAVFLTGWMLFMSSNQWRMMIMMNRDGKYSCVKNSFSKVAQQLLKSTRSWYQQKWQLIVK